MKHGTFNRPELFSIQAKNPRKLSAGLWKKQIEEKGKSFQILKHFYSFTQLFFSPCIKFPTR